MKKFVNVLAVLGTGFLCWGLSFGYLMNLLRTLGLAMKGCLAFYPALTASVLGITFIVFLGMSVLIGLLCAGFVSCLIEQKEYQPR